MVITTVIKKIALARYLRQLAVRELDSASELSVFAGVNILHDAVEAFILAVAEHVNAKISPTTKFEQYLDIIDEKINPRCLPFRSKLLRLNRVRIDSKHYAMRPDKEEGRELSLAVKEFFDEVSDVILLVKFDTISLVDLLDDHLSKDMLKEAQEHLTNNRYVDCLISCRKAIYLEIERQYDVVTFMRYEEVAAGLGVMKHFCRAPSFAMTKEFIEKHVREPTDSIVIDRDNLHQQLLEYRIDPTEFWNVWRSTPSVCFMADSKSWCIKREVGKLERKDIKEIAEYVLPTTVNMILCIHLQNRARIVTKGGSRLILLKQDKTPVYEKADKSSSIVGTTSIQVRTLYSDHSVTGFDGETYWFVHDLKEPITGYVRQDDVEGSASTPSEIKVLLGVDTLDARLKTR